MVVTYSFMYNNDMNELLTEENITAQAKVRLAQCERSFNEAMIIFKEELRNGKNVSASYSKLTRIVDSYPEHAPQIVIRRAVTTAGLAALSKSPYLYSYMNRCIKNTVNRLIRAETVNGAVNNVLNSAIVNFENRLKQADDAEVQTGIKNVLESLRTSLQLVNSYSGRISAEKERQQMANKIANVREDVEFSDEEVAEFIDNLLSEAYESGVIYFDNENYIINENLRSATRKIAGGVTNVSHSVSRAVDTVSDTMIEQRRKNEIMAIRKEVMNGRKSISTYIKTLTAFIAWENGVIPHFMIVPIVRGIIRRKKMRQQEQINLINELRTELEIINEKIKDSEIDNDRQKKYNYMRLRREIQRSIDQIKFGQRVNINRHAMKL